MAPDNLGYRRLAGDRERLDLRTPVDAVGGGVGHLSGLLLPGLEVAVSVEVDDHVLVGRVVGVASDDGAVPEPAGDGDLCRLGVAVRDVVLEDRSLVGGAVLVVGRETLVDGAVPVGELERYADSLGHVGRGAQLEADPDGFPGAEELPVLGVAPEPGGVGRDVAVGLGLPCGEHEHCGQCRHQRCCREPRRPGYGPRSASHLSLLDDIGCSPGGLPVGRMAGEPDGTEAGVAGHADLVSEGSRRPVHGCCFAWDSNSRMRFFSIE